MVPPHLDDPFLDSEEEEEGPAEAALARRGRGLRLSLGGGDVRLPLKLGQHLTGGDAGAHSTSTLCAKMSSGQVHSWRATVVRIAREVSLIACHHEGRISRSPESPSGCGALRH